MKLTPKAWLQWLAPLVLLIALIFAFRDQLPFLGQAFSTLLEADPLPLVAGAFTAVSSLVAMAEVMRLLMNSGNTLRVSTKDTVAITIASNAWSTTIPGGPAFSAWLTYRVQRSWGATLGLCGWFLVVSSIISTMWLVLIGIAAVLFLGADLSLPTLFSSLVASIVLMTVVYWVTTHPEKLRAWAASWPQCIRRNAIKVIDQLATVRMTPQAFLGASTHSLLNRLFDVATLYFSVWAVTGSAPGLTAGTSHTTVMGVALGYVMAKLAGSAQITPGGVGTVEALTAGALVASGMTLVDATAATLVYRLISFIFISAVGWIVFLFAYARKGFMLGRQEHAPFD
ncbi:YbhN family protein [Corynebacterium breve]|uniref:YbhN family protein n=1 Tax=Corynebacterium breve TaxID=3049799 RepID=A0ABY8VCW3_9CORY|nr:YbhN family protein [Corynebacterium breve]WIM67500.1 YbhN family protein [Corynebacterium breve]